MVICDYIMNVKSVKIMPGPIDIQRGKKLKDFPVGLSVKLHNSISINH
jgi:hypothetical protein